MKTKTIILSIHPQHIAKILSGEKCFEYRKKIPTDIEYLIVYATFPIKKVVAVIEIDTVLRDSAQNIWERTQKHAGVSYEFLMHYFNDTEEAFAIKFKNIHQLSTPMNITVIENIKSAPQSYQYVHEPISDLCKKLGVKIR